MILTLTNGNQTATFWKAERLVLAVDETIALIGDGVRLWCTGIGSVSNPIAFYNQTSSDDLKIDVTDLLRAYKPANLYWCVVADDGTIGQTNSIAMTYAGLINPASVIIPQHILQSNLKIVPPSHMLSFGLNEVIAEVYSGSIPWSVTGATKSADGRQVTGIAGDFTLSSVGKSHTYNVAGLTCGVNYALVRWVSFTGVTRVHVFEVVKCKSESVDNYSLLPTDNEFVEIKGRRDSFVLKLDGLDAYDYWYYSDLLLSSKVEVALDQIFLDWAQVQVTTKNVIIPDGEAGEKGKLEINVNWKRYDAVSM